MIGQTFGGPQTHRYREREGPESVTVYGEAKERQSVRNLIKTNSVDEGYYKC